MNPIPAILCIFLLSFLVLQVTPLLIVTLEPYNRLYPNMGGVGSSVSVNGTINTAGGRYSVGFDIDGDGNALETGEILVTGQATGEFNDVPAIFVVPHTFGSLVDNGEGLVGTRHIVSLRDDANGSIGSLAFFVQTTFNLTVASKTPAGTYVPIKFTMDGADPNSTYRIELQVTAPDGQSIILTNAITATPDSTGHYTVEVNYPSSFSNAKETPGNYDAKAIVYQVINLRGSSTTYKQLATLTQPFQISQADQPQQLSATINLITPNPATAGQTVTFSGSGSGTIVAYRWTSSIDGFLSSDADFATSTLSVGSHTISLEVEDNTGMTSQSATANLLINSGEANPNVTDESNITPTAYIDSSLPATVSVGQTIMFNGHGTDPDGTIVACCWVSSIDGTFATTLAVSVSNFSVGTHHITFSVQDDKGAWSDAITQQVTVASTAQSGLSPMVVAAVAGCVLAVVGVASYYGLRVRQQKSENQKPKIPKIHKLSLNISLPSIVTAGAATQVPVNVKNIGTAKLSNVSLSAYATPGLRLSNATQRIRRLEVGKQVSLSFPFQAENNACRGFYTFRLETDSKGFPVRPKNFPIRVCKIGMLTQSESPLQKHLQTQLTNIDPLGDFSNLSKDMLKYDLLIVPPGSVLTLQAVKNLASYVESGQSVLVMGEIPQSNSPLVQELFGYTNSKLPSNASATIKMSDNPHPVTNDFQPRTFQVACKEGSWQSKTSTAQVLASHCNASGEILAPAVVVNLFGRGRVMHFNFEPSEYGAEVWALFKKSIDWMLKQ
jgi:hypothetical protein